MPKNMQVAYFINGTYVPDDTPMVPNDTPMETEYLVDGTYITEHTMNRLVREWKRVRIRKHQKEHRQRYRK